MRAAEDTHTFDTDEWKNCMGLSSEEELAPIEIKFRLMKREGERRLGAAFRSEHHFVWWKTEKTSAFSRALNSGERETFHIYTICMHTVKGHTYDVKCLKIKSKHYKTLKST